MPDLNCTYEADRSYGSQPQGKKGFCCCPCFLFFWLDVGYLMYCCGDELSVVRLIFNSNRGVYKRVEFGLCQDCGTAHLHLFVINSKGKIKSKFFKGKTALKEFKRYEHLKNNCKQGTKTNQNVYYGDFRKTRKKDKNGHPVYLQLRKNFNGDYEILNEIQTVIHNG